VFDDASKGGSIYCRNHFEKKGKKGKGEEEGGGGGRGGWVGAPRWTFLAK
jgi:hypothetical protein